MLQRYHRRFLNFLTRLVQNLTLRNDCNLIPSAHGTQRVVLSMQSLDIHITRLRFQIRYYVIMWLKGLQSCKRLMLEDWRHFKFLRHKDLHLNNFLPTFNFNLPKFCSQVSYKNVPSMHALLPCDGPVESFFNFI